MTNRFYLAILILLMAGCYPSEKSVAGTWRNGTDTIKFDNDRTFYISQGKTGDASIHVGTWRVSKRSISLNFADTAGEISFQKCRSLQFSRTFFGRTSLIRSRSCIVQRPQKPIFYTRID